jgi:hypothetical protein
MIARLLILSLATLALVPAPAQAAEGDEILGQFRDWYAVAYEEQGKKICYMVSRPKTSAGDYTRRGAIYVQVTRRSGDAEPDVVSFEAGYPFQGGSALEVEIDGAGHELFTKGETAWAYDADGDKALVKAMAKGREMVVKGTSARGTVTTDTYSLMGFMAAQR